MLLRDGRLVWTGLSVRARLPAPPSGKPSSHRKPTRTAASTWCPARWHRRPRAGRSASPMCFPSAIPRWRPTWSRWCTRSRSAGPTCSATCVWPTSATATWTWVASAGTCWVVTPKAGPIAQEHEVPASCGVIIAAPDGRLDVVRHAPRRVVPDLPFSLWMALAKATSLPASTADAAPTWLARPPRGAGKLGSGRSESGDEPSQAQLADQVPHLQSRHLMRIGEQATTTRCRCATCAALRRALGRSGSALHAVSDGTAGTPGTPDGGAAPRAAITSRRSVCRVLPRASRARAGPTDSMPRATLLEEVKTFRGALRGDGAQSPGRCTGRSCGSTAR